MTDEFRTDDRGVTAKGLKTLTPRSKKSMYIWNVIRLALDVFACLCAIYLVKMWNMSNQDIIVPAIYVLMAAIAVYLIVSPLIFYARYRYCVAEDRIDVLRGIVTIRHTVVPIERVHQVEVTRGPINSMFKLANVTITTAGGSAVIQYLELDEAERIANRLNDIINRIVEERE